MAYDAGFGSIEADIFLVDTALYVAHDQHELLRKIKLEKEYLQPIDSCLKTHNGFPYGEPGKKLQILIDIKSDSIHTLEALIRLLKKYQARIHCPFLSWVITGNRPDPALFAGYPVFISFDGGLHRDYSRDALSRIVLLSDDFKNYSSWNGEKDLAPAEEFVLRAAKKNRIRFINRFVSGMRRINPIPEKNSELADGLYQYRSYCRADRISR